MPNLALAARNIAGLAARQIARAADRLSGRKARVRRQRRADREQEQSALAEEEGRVIREVAALARGSRPIVVGPWLSEVGFEVLYWVPFVRWASAEHGLDPDRLTVVSRGGTASWYGSVARSYVDVFDLLPFEEFARRNRQRIADEAGGQKQMGATALDRELVSRAASQLGLDEPATLHPSLMYRLFRQFWAGNRSLDSVVQKLRFEAPAGDRSVPLPALPEQFVAVKLYTGTALPDSHGNRTALREWIAQISGGRPVVLLDSPPALDDHADFGADVARPSLTLRGAMTASNNLAVQTEVLRRAECFITTCGGLAWLAPMMGVDTVAVYSDDRFLATHLYLARHVYRRMPSAGAFATVDLRGMTAMAALAAHGSKAAQ
jgi:hypothetical protein